MKVLKVIMLIKLYRLHSEAHN